jgi:hypothetical protein
MDVAGLRDLLSQSKSEKNEGDWLTLIFFQENQQIQNENKLMQKIAENAEKKLKAKKCKQQFCKSCRSKIFNKLSSTS